MKLLLLGATGLVGRNVLRQALASDKIGQVVAPTRRPLQAHPKLDNPTASDLRQVAPQALRHPVDAVVCAMGTTIAKAGSKAAFRHVDYVLPILFAGMARQQGARSLALVSSPGASLSIPLFYCRIKGEVERDMRAMGFESLAIIRPGMIGGHRDEFRLAERLIFPVAAMLGPILPRGLRINPAANIARALLEAVIAQAPGERLMTSKDLV